MQDKTIKHIPTKRLLVLDCISAWTPVEKYYFTDVKTRPKSCGCTPSGYGCSLSR